MSIHYQTIFSCDAPGCTMIQKEEVKVPADPRLQGYMLPLPVGVGWVSTSFGLFCPRHEIVIRERITQ